MARSKSNPRRADHERLANQELEKAAQAMERAEGHAAKDHFGRALTDAVVTASVASVAQAEAEHAQDQDLVREARDLVRASGNLILVSVAGIQREAGMRDEFGADRALSAQRNPSKRQPGVTPLFLIRSYSSSILTGGDEIYLVINTEGEVMDAIITDSEDFGPMEDAGYGNLSILELDVSGAQHRKLKKLGKRLSEVTRTRPTFRPGRGGTRVPARTQPFRARTSSTAANPSVNTGKLKQRLLR